jgi:uncharacterized protein YbjT (DUF2867 family)
MATLVVGATGLVGQEVCRQLRQAGIHVRALVRRTSDPHKRADLQNLGVELVEGDLKDPASLVRACAGIQSVVSTASSTLARQAGDSIESVDRDGQLALLSAARVAHVEHFVFVSFRDNPHIQYPLTSAKRAVEQALMTSGMRYTILQASYFMEIWLSPALGFDIANRNDRLYGDGTQPVSWISYRDVARAIVAAVTQTDARNQLIEVGGPHALSQREVAEMCTKAGAGEMSVERVPEAALRSQMEAASDSLQKSFAGLMLQCAAGDVIEASAARHLSWSPVVSVRDYIRAQLVRA